MKIKTFQGLSLPVVGQGCGLYDWQDNHIDIIKQGIDLGLTFIDTAENYGRSEEIVGKAIKGIRGKVIISTKFDTKHITQLGIQDALHNSLKVLKTDYIDIYQLHWYNYSIPFKDIFEILDKLRTEGKIRYIGVCNLYLQELMQISEISKYITVQMEYNLFDRYVEKEILPFCSVNDSFFIAYSPFDQGNWLNIPSQRKLLQEMAYKYNCTESQIILSWLIQHEPVIVIPKSTNIIHLKENATVNITLDAIDFNLLDKLKAEVKYVLPSEIKVSLEGQNNRVAYQSLQEALENANNNTPSPLTLSKHLVPNIKPVRLIRSKTEGYEYDLVEGRIRYWAWVIANSDTPIPAYIRGDIDEK